MVKKAAHLDFVKNSDIHRFMSNFDNKIEYLSNPVKRQSIPDGKGTPDLPNMKPKEE